MDALHSPEHLTQMMPDICPQEKCPLPLQQRFNSKIKIPTYRCLYANVFI